ncbi:MAG TPA: ShlB/FhaC/HecB family hemolysin secretion/activation protein [Limnobacter sp.]|nr:ShlB/FhaC/HecB family hemolysin secretion/activation protein [Limnobacter sp.]
MSNTVKRLALVNALAGLGLMAPALGQAAMPILAQAAIPDAGRLDRELQPPLEAPKPGVGIPLPGLSRIPVTPGGEKVQLQGVRFTGNTVFTSEALLAVISSQLQKPLDLAQVSALAEDISRHYRDQGYGFGRAFIQNDSLKDGVLTIRVVEGAYGRKTIKADSDTRTAQASAFLDGVVPGAPIYVPDLERQILILDDQPGYDVLPVIKAGTQTGEGDLDVNVTRTPKVTGNISVSNHGNRYTGYFQARSSININSPFRFGDQVQISSLVSDENLSSVSASYNTPLGTSGLRATVGVSRTDYELGREFSNLNARGEAEVLTAGLSYPIVRSRRQNLTAAVTVQQKDFFDEQRAVNSQVSRSSDSMSLILNFDQLGNGSVTYGQVDTTFGDFDGPANDPGRVNGDFMRINYDLVHLRSVASNWSVSARLSGQVAGDNLDSSESFSLGGPFAVRAYPTGESTGDEGNVIQLELRYQTQSRFSPFVFYDAGNVRTEDTPTAPGKNTRTLTGAGVGVRYQDGPLSADLMAAKRLSGGASQSDPRDDSVTAWMLLRYSF